MTQTLIVLAACFVVFVLFVVVRRLRLSHVPDTLSSDVLSRINTEYSELPQ